MTDHLADLKGFLARCRDGGGGRVVLAGTAGTGKTTLVNRVLQAREFDDFTLLAPTGKAARRLTQVTGKVANTIHSKIYGGPEEDDRGQPIWKDPVPFGGPGHLAVVDEASMLGTELTTDLGMALMPGTTVLYVGDPAQLKPVDDSPGVDLHNPDVRLTHVHRSSDGIMQLAYALLAAKTEAQLAGVINNATKYKGVYSPGKHDAPGTTTPERWRASTIAAGSDSTLITFRNGPRHWINNRTRAALGLGMEELRAGEVLIVMSNNKEAGFFNGELLSVVGHKDDDPDRPLHLNQLVVRSFLGGPPRTIYTTVAGFGQSPRDWREERRTDVTAWKYRMDHPWGFQNPRWKEQALAAKDGYRDFRTPGPMAEAVHVNFGYCLTCHKMQGSEADNVGIVWVGNDESGKYWSDWYFLRKDLEETRAWWYTAVTRARNAVVIWK